MPTFKSPPRTTRRPRPEPPLVIYTGPLTTEQIESTTRSLGICYPTRQIVLAVRNPNELPLTIAELETSLRVSSFNKEYATPVRGEDSLFKIDSVE